MTPDADALPTDPDALRALLLAERAQHAEAIAQVEQERDAAVSESARLRAIIQAVNSLPTATPVSRPIVTPLGMLRWAYPRSA